MSIPQPLYWTVFRHLAALRLRSPGVSNLSESLQAMSASRASPYPVCHLSASRHSPFVERFSANAACLRRSSPACSRRRTRSWRTATLADYSHGLLDQYADILQIPV